MSRLNMEIDPETQRQIKTLATFAGLSIKDCILAKTLPPKAKTVDSMQQLLGSSKNAARLRKAIAAPSSKQLVFNSLNDLENALGI